MRFPVALIAICAVACSAAIPAEAKCTAAEEAQIAEVRNSWVTNWNAKQLDNVVKLYAADATYLPPDGSRVSGQSEIRAFFEKQIGSKVEVHSRTLDCSSDIVADSGAYTQDLPGGGGVTVSGGATISGGVTMGGGGKRIEGNYLVVLRREGGKWLLARHAATAKP
jgi:ketosteroid isomerase-like protein